MWGSTGWECISVGVPCMLSVNFTEYQFHKLFGYSLPPAMFNTHSADDVTNSMLKCFFDKEIEKSKATKNIEWFESNNGISLAEKWLTYL